MKLLESFKSALLALRANKLRSVLTMLGVIIGVGSIILLVALGSGARTEITSALQGMGSDRIVIMPYGLDLSNATDFAAMGSAMMTANTFTMDTAKLIDDALDREAMVSAEIAAAATIEADRNKISSIVIGGNYNEFELLNYDTSEGRFYTELELNSSRYVAVIGQTVANTLFGEGTPALGKTITIKGRKFKVIGVMEKVGTTLTYDMDTQVFIPNTVAIKVFGTNRPNEILVRARSPETVEEDAETIRKAMLKEHSEDSFAVLTQSEVMGFAKSITQILTYLLGGIAGISLVVGGIGIMNIMLVSVTERTREIGIRKAVGAKTRDILIQFLVESVVLSVIGGLIGITIAMGGAWLYTKAMGVLATVTWPTILLAFFFSLLVGIFFGVVPAKKASELDPIESLRYE